jgi:hypothetical protein
MAHRDVFVGDVVAAIWAQGSPHEFRASPIEIQAAFRLVSEEYPDLLGGLSFGPSGAPVNSPAIKAALDALTLGNYMTRRNPDLSNYVVGPDGRLTNWYESDLKARLDAVGIDQDRLVEASTFFFDTLEKVQQERRIEDLLVLN